MLISEVINLARSGELNNLSPSDARVINYIDLGMIELYKRFQLRSAEAIITMEEGSTTYTLDQTDTRVQMDSTALDVMAIQEVYDESGANLSINVENDELGVMTPMFNQIQIPNPADGEVLGVLYLAAPKYITDVSETLQLPLSLLEALLHYIGYRAHGAVDGKVEAETTTHYQKFEASVARAELLGVVTMDDVADRSTQERFL